MNNIERDKLSTEEKNFLENIQEVGTLRAKDIMFPRSEILDQAISVDQSVDKIIEIFGKSKFLTFPVYEGSLDNVLGFLRINKLFSVIGKGGVLNLRSIVDSPLFVSPSIRIFELIIKMRLNGDDLALIVDEFGGIDGMINMDILIDEIVGKFQDSDHNLDFQIIEEDKFLVSGKYAVDDLEELIGFKIPDHLYDDDIQTIGGLLSFVKSRVPSRGELIIIDNWEFAIQDADPRRVKQVLIKRIKKV